MAAKRVTDTRKQRQIFVVLAAAGLAAVLQEFVLRPGIASKLKVRKRR